MKTPLSDTISSSLYNWHQSFFSSRSSRPSVANSDCGRLSTLPIVFHYFPFGNTKIFSYLPRASSQHPLQDFLSEKNNFTLVFFWENFSVKELHKHFLPWSFLSISSDTTVFRNPIKSRQKLTGINLHWWRNRVPCISVLLGTANLKAVNNSIRW